MDDVDVDAARDPKRRKLIHHASRRVAGRATTEQELVVSFSNELQKSSVALGIYQQSKADIMKMQVSSRAHRTEYVR